MGMRQSVDRQEWLAQARERFGDEPLDWPFRCAKCGHVQTGRGMMETCGFARSTAMGRVVMSCEGRWNKDVGCDWTLGGLFQIHEVEVIMEDGEHVPVFVFAEASVE